MQLSYNLYPLCNYWRWWCYYYSATQRLNCYFVAGCYYHSQYIHLSLRYGLFSIFHIFGEANMAVEWLSKLRHALSWSTAWHHPLLLNLWIFCSLTWWDILLWENTSNISLRFIVVKTKIKKFIPSSLFYELP